MLWPGLANGLPEVGRVPWGSSLFCVGGENDVSSAITEKGLLIINSIQFSMNWIGIELKDFELELKAWTDRNWSIQSIHFQFNSSFYMVKHFFICHIMEIVVWQAIPCKQAYPHAPLCVPSMGSAGVFGHKGITITSITLRYFQCFNSLVMKSFFVTQKDHQLISPL